jgi:hypothetical protein
MPDDLLHGHVITSGDEDFDAAFDGTEPADTPEKNAAEPKEPPAAPPPEAPAETPAAPQTEPEAKPPAQPETPEEAPAQTAAAPEEPPTPPILPEDLAALEEDWGPELRRYVEWQLEHGAEGVVGKLLTPERVTELLKQAGIDPGKLAQVARREAEAEAERAAFETFQNQVFHGFERNGKKVEGHPDALKVMRAPEFSEWFSAQEVEPQKLNDPGEAVALLSRFKEEQARRAAEDYDGQFGQGAKEVQAALAGGIGSKGSSGLSGAAPKQNPNDFDSAFEEASR